jgi:hypothetical protein
MIVLDPIWQLALLLFAHWIGDFAFQTTWMATSKSRRLDALFAHVLTYSATLAIASITLFAMTEVAALFVACNALLHLVTDFITSRISASLQAKQNTRGFFIVLGLDQLLHHLALAGTLSFFLRAH